MVGVLISFFELGVIYVGGKALFGIAFGKNWSYSGQISRILVWPYIIYFFTFSFNTIFLALREIGKLSLYQFTNFALIVSLFFIPVSSFKMFLYLFLCVNVLSALIFGILLISIIKSYENNLKTFV